MKHQRHPAATAAPLDACATDCAHDVEYANIDAAVARLRAMPRVAPERDFIDDFDDGNMLGVKQAAFVIDREEKAVREWCKEKKERKIHINFASTFVISLPRLLDYIQLCKGGLPARLSAETRFSELLSKMGTNVPI